MLINEMGESFHNVYIYQITTITLYLIILYVNSIAIKLKFKKIVALNTLSFFSVFAHT